MSVFTRAVEELLAINLAQSALFFFGFGLTVLPQKALEPEGYCRSRVYQHYEAAVSLSLFLVFSTFASTVVSGFVKYRVPGLADGGLQALAPKRRQVVRYFAAIGCLLNLVASVLALLTYNYILQAKIGLFECLPLATRVCAILTYLVVGVILVVTYSDNAWRIVMTAQ